MDYLLSQFSSTRIRLIPFSELRTKSLNTDSFYSIFTSVRVSKSNIFKQLTTNFRKVVVAMPFFTEDINVRKVLPKKKMTMCSCKIAKEPFDCHLRWILWTRGSNIRMEKCYVRHSAWEDLDSALSMKLQSDMVSFLNRTACSLKSRTMRTYGMTSGSEELGPTSGHLSHQSSQTSAELQNRDVSSASVQSTRIMSQRMLGYEGPQRSPDSNGTISEVTQATLGIFPKSVGSGDWLARIQTIHNYQYHSNYSEDIETLTDHTLIIHRTLRAVPLKKSRSKQSFSFYWSK